MRGQHTPVLFIIYNRPDLTERVFELIRSKKLSKLYISADGPNPDKLGDSENCRLAREITEKIDWPCQVKRLYRNTNLGCKLAVSEAITWFFNEVEAGVILEDDCLPHPDFFNFCSSMLQKYKGDPSVGHISGVNFLDLPGTYTSYSHSKVAHAHIWGWASWREVWNGYSLQPLSKEKFAWDKIPGNLFYKLYWYRKLLLVQKGKIDTWDYPYQYHLWKLNYKSILPGKNLITNIGFDERATHTKVKNKNFADKPSESMNYKKNNCSPDQDSGYIDKQITGMVFKHNPMISVLKFILANVTPSENWKYKIRASVE